VLDAQFYGVPQRRRRVFVVGYLGDWRRAAAVLFERYCLSGNPPPSREAGARIAASLTRGAESSGKGGYAGRRREDDFNIIPSTGDTAHCLNAGGMGRQDYETETLIAHSLRADGFDASEDGTGRGTPIIPILEVGKGSSSRGDGPNGCGIGNADDPMYTLQAGAQHAVAFGWNKSSSQTPRVDETTDSLQASPTSNPAIAYQCHGSNVGPMGHLRAGNGNEAGGVPFTISVRGREGEHRLEYRQDGVANAILTPNGGRAGIGCGAVAFAQNQRDELRTMDVAGALASEPGMKQQTYLKQGMAVRRLTPRECERLQGFPDDYTLIEVRGKPAADGPRYKALGNSMAVPVLRWIGERILMVEAA
jgi:DNA (cytosine-5)-methyltransferase 1